MAFMSDVQTVAANAVVANAFVGKTQEFVTVPSTIQFAIVAAAVGLFATILVGDTVVLEDQEVDGSGTFPTFPDFFLYQSGGLPSDRIVVKLRNSTGAGILTRSVAAVSAA